MFEISRKNCFVVSKYVNVPNHWIIRSGRHIIVNSLIVWQPQNLRRCNKKLQRRVNCIRERAFLTIVSRRLLSQVEHVRVKINDLTPSPPPPATTEERASGKKFAFVSWPFFALRSVGGGGGLNFFAPLSSHTTE